MRPWPNSKRPIKKANKTKKVSYSHRVGLAKESQLSGFILQGTQQADGETYGKIMALIQRDAAVVMFAATIFQENWLPIRDRVTEHLQSVRISGVGMHKKEMDFTIKVLPPFNEKDKISIGKTVLYVIKDEQGEDTETNFFVGTVPIEGGITKHRAAIAQRYWKELGGKHSLTNNKAKTRHI